MVQSILQLVQLGCWGEKMLETRRPRPARRPAAAPPRTARRKSSTVLVLYAASGIAIALSHEFDFTYLHPAPCLGSSVDEVTPLCVARNLRRM